MKEKCPHCGNKLKIKEDIDNLPEVVLYNDPKIVSIFKQCFKCKYFFAKWFVKNNKDRTKE